MSPAATATRSARAGGTARAVPRRSPAPARKPARPHLRVVENPTRRARRQRRRLGFVGAATIVTLLTVVTFHVILAQSQLTLERIEQRTAAVERRYEDARLEHARLSAPSRIVERARELGLVSPAAPPTSITVAGKLPPAHDAPSSTLEEWAAVKPTLGAGP